MSTDYFVDIAKLKEKRDLADRCSKYRKVNVNFPKQVIGHTW